MDAAATDGAPTDGAETGSAESAAHAMHAPVVVMPASTSRAVNLPACLTVPCPPYSPRQNVTAGADPIERAPGGNPAAPVASCAVPAPAPDSGAGGPDAGGPTPETPVGMDRANAADAVGGRFRPPGPPAQRRLEFRRRLHSSRGPLRASTTRARRRCPMPWSRPGVRRGDRGAWAGCAATAAIGRARRRRPSSRTRWATSSRPSASCRPGWRRSRRAWPRRTGRSTGRPGSPRRASWAPGSSPWPRTCGRPRRVATWCTPTAARGRFWTRSPASACRPTASSRAARWLSTRWNAAGPSPSARPPRTWSDGRRRRWVASC